VVYAMAERKTYHQNYKQEDEFSWRDLLVHTSNGIPRNVVGVAD
jgi:hypothetical protein